MGQSEVKQNMLGEWELTLVEFYKEGIARVSVRRVVDAATGEVENRILFVPFRQ